MGTCWFCGDKAEIVHTYSGNAGACKSCQSDFNSDDQDTPEEEQMKMEVWSLCPNCNGKGYTEYETGVTDGIYKETLKEPCECILEEESQI